MVRNIELKVVSATLVDEDTISLQVEPVNKNITLNSGITWGGNSLVYLLQILDSRNNKITGPEFNGWYTHDGNNSHGLGALMAAIDSDTDFTKEVPPWPESFKTEKYNNFLNEHLRFIVERALDLLKPLDGDKPLIGKIKILESGERLFLSQLECLCIISNSFLSRWYKGESYKGSECNFVMVGDKDKFHHFNFRVAKCRALMEYFMARKKDYENPTKLESMKNTYVMFYFNTVDIPFEKGWFKGSEAQAKVEYFDNVVSEYGRFYPLVMNIMPLNDGRWSTRYMQDNYDRRQAHNNEGMGDKHPHLIDDPSLKSTSMCVDFANEYIGGGALSYGHVQEEELFTLHTEYCCAGLFCKVMGENDAIILAGAQQFTENKTENQRKYYNIVEYADPNSKKEKRMEINGKSMIPMVTICIDAIDFRGLSMVNPGEIYTHHNLFKELGKCYAGFSIARELDHIKYIRTGNWGGGAFAPYPQGSPECNEFIIYKALIQLVASTLSTISSGKPTLELDYCPYDQHELMMILNHINHIIIKCGVSIKDIYDILKDKVTEGLQQRSYLLTRFNNIWREHSEG